MKRRRKTISALLRKGGFPNTARVTEDISHVAGLKGRDRYSVRAKPSRRMAPTAKRRGRPSADGGTRDARILVAVDDHVQQPDDPEAAMLATAAVLEQHQRLDLQRLDPAWRAYLDAQPEGSLERSLVIAMIEEKLHSLEGPVQPGQPSLDYLEIRRTFVRLDDVIETNGATKTGRGNKVDPNKPTWQEKERLLLAGENVSAGELRLGTTSRKSLTRQRKKQRL